MAQHLAEDKAERQADEAEGGHDEHRRHGGDPPRPQRDHLIIVIV